MQQVMVRVNKKYINSYLKKHNNIKNLSNARIVDIMLNEVMEKTK